MFGGLASVVGMARRITRSAESMRLRRHTLLPARASSGPGLVRGRGLARRRPRSPLPSDALPWLVAALLAAVIVSLYFLYGL